MKALCITGLGTANLAKVSSFVIQGGIAEAKPIERSATVTIQDWERKVIAKLSPSSSTLKISNLWKQLAADLLLSNLESDIWAWIGTPNVTLLEFWAELDHDIYFLLLCPSLQNMLAEGIKKGANYQELSAGYENWCNFHESLLSFYLKYSDRCLLVDSNSAAHNPAELLNAINKRWQWRLNTSENNIDNYEPDLAQYIAQQIQKEQFPLPEFVAELNAAQHPVNNKAGNTNSGIAPTLEEIVVGYQNEQEAAAKNLAHRQHLENEAEALLLELNKAQIELEQALTDKEALQQQADDAQQQQALQNQLSELQAERNQLAQSNDQLQAHLNHVENEAEKLLIELHNTQLELEQALTRQIELEAQPQQTAGPVASRTALSRLWSGKKTSLPKLSFSELELRHVQVNQDYEHLWFSLKNPEFGKRQLSQWQFRLSCAAIRPGQFGSQPKLEFPKQSQQLLGNWFAESQDDFGEKLELRFALPDAMDKGLWKKLGKEDQQLLQALIGQLPAMLQQAQQRRPALTRAWQDWHSLAQDVQRIYALKTKKGK